MLRRVVDLIAPVRLGTDFRWLQSSSWISNLGDGLAVAAAPLLVASLTDDAFVVALSAVLRYVPWLLIGPPIGAALFAAGRSWPFLGQAVLISAGTVLIAAIARPTTPSEREPAHLRHDIAEGYRWAVSHPAVRTLVLTIVLFNITFGAAWAVLVLWARERLGLHELGFGLLLMLSALGSVVGGVLYGSITARFRLSTLMRAGLVLETVIHLALAVTTVPWVAMVILFLFGIHAMVWGTTSTSIRQLSVPDELQGRVNGVNMVGVYGSMVGGSLLGGAIAQQWGVTAPFWFAFVGSAAFVVLLWRQLANVAHDA